MAGRYDSFRSLASRLINKNGRDVVYNRETAAVPTDANEPWNIRKVNNPDPTPIGVKAVIVPLMHKQADGTVVKVTDRTCFISAADVISYGTEVDVRPGDTITDGSKKFNIVEVDDISPGAQKVLYIATLRGK